MITNNFKIDIPKTPVGIFADLGVYEETYRENKLSWDYNAGIYFSFSINEEIIGVIYC